MTAYMLQCIVVISNCRRMLTNESGPEIFGTFGLTKHFLLKLKGLRMKKRKYTIIFTIVIGCCEIEQY